MHGAGGEPAGSRRVDLVDFGAAEDLVRRRFLGFVGGAFLLCVPFGVVLGLRARTLSTLGLWLIAATYLGVLVAWYRNRTRYRPVDAAALLAVLNVLPAGLLIAAHSPVHVIALTVYFTLGIVTSGFLLGPRWALGLVPIDVALIVYGYVRFADRVRGTPLEEPLRLTTVRGVVVVTLLGLVVWFFSRELRAVLGRATEANRGLRASEEALAGFVRDAPDGIVSLDGAGVIRRFNPAAEAMTGLAAAEVVGRHFMDVGLVSAEERARIGQIFSQFRGEPGGAPVEIRYARPDGRACIVEAGGRLVTHPDGAIEIHSVLRDVTARHQLEEQLRQSQRLDAVGRLAGGIAHDFNNLLTVVLSNAASIAQRSPPGSDTAEEAADVLEAAGRAAELTRQLLAFSRRQVLEPRVLDLAEVVRRMERLLRRVIPESIAVVFEASGSAVPVRADPAQVEQVLVNLAVNARDAMAEGGRLSIRVDELDAADPARAAHAVPPGRWAHLCVEDTGHGIAPDVLSRVFDPFFTTKTGRGGTGLGLATVHGIVRQGQGHVWVTSEPGATAFHVLFPLHEGEIPPAAPAPDAAADAARPLCVLLVEDEPAVREVTERTLARRGHRVIAATSPEEAIDKARALGEEVDVLVTDVVMPGMSGARLAHVLRKERAGLPVLYLSGHAGDALPEDELQRPGVAFLAKPFAADALFAALAALTKRS